MSRTVRTVTRVIGILLMAGGLVMMVLGVVAWNMASSELAKQKINVAESGQAENIANGPFDALSQIHLIQKHVNEGVSNFGFPEGTVYAQIPMPDSQLLASCKSDATQAATADCKTALAADAARSYLDNANFKQASLYTSILAFGVAALVVGLGLALILIGWVEFARSARKQQVAMAVAVGEERELVGV